MLFVSFTLFSNFALDFWWGVLTMKCWREMESCLDKFELDIRREEKKKADKTETQCGKKAEDQLEGPVETRWRESG